MGALATSAAHGQSLSVSSPGDLLAAGPGALTQVLETARRAPVSGEAKARVLASLPAEGEVTRLSAGAREKLATLTRVLRAGDRESVYEVKVIDVRQAAVGLHGQAVLLISEHALNLLDAVELQAIVAHEIGHDYVWEYYEQAKRSADRHRLQELELMCDAVAVAILHRLDIHWSALIKGLEKLSHYNRERFGPTLNEADYPTVAQRRLFARALAANVGTPKRPPAER
jgi:predicted Zn-dependent protease